MLKAIVVAYKRHLIYTRTLKELERLSDRELYDLGVDRSDIIRLAHEATYSEEIKFEFKPFRDFFKVKTEKNKMDEYLADSANIVDLENRLKELDRGLAPWQVQARIFAKGWV
jgi:uncharacterized protein YjiS (DUF1127 family)